jgi:FkbM family methyltransferase
MLDVLNEYCLDTENSKYNFNLALEYDKIGQTASAISFYLRAAERSEDPELSYTSILKMALCFQKQGGRIQTVKGAYQQAITILPKRPEAYYLLAKIHRETSIHHEAYSTIEIALNICDFDDTKLCENVGYSGYHDLIFEKAVSSWWWGKKDESRKLFRRLFEEYWDVLDEKSKEVVIDHISRLGYTSRTQSFLQYDKTKYHSLRYNFPGLETIDRNYSQVYQDMFVLSMLKGKKNGTYLEVGSCHPFDGSNTALLETKFKWSGVSIEFKEDLVNSHNSQRLPTAICADALKIDYRSLLKEKFSTKTIDYLQLDIEPAKNTYEVLLKIPFDEYKFAVITYEHDHYVDATKKCREKSREYLQSNGYILVVSDISSDGVCSYEDWWVHPDLVDHNVIQIMKDTSDEIKEIEKYFLNKKFYAEFETDKYIFENFFPDLTYNGVIVEVGAGPPEFLSNSKFFRDHGWRSICIEPNPKFVEQHKNLGSEVYQYACSNTEGKSNFTINLNNDHWYSETHDGVSFSALEIRYDGVPEHNTQNTIEVERIKLNTLLEKLSIEKVDILSIDVEGWELEVLMGFDHLKYNPKVIVLENFEKNIEYEKFMNSIGYTKNINLGYNEVYFKNQTESSNRKIFSISEKTQNTVWSVDNFYENPDAVREFALNQEYVEGGFGRGFIGRRTDKQFLFPGLKEKFEEIIGMKITEWESHGMNGRFQNAHAGEPLVWHCDSQKWGGMLYLTPDAPYQCGTTLYAHKKTRARSYYDEGWDAAWKDIPGDPHLDGTSFEPVDVLGNVYNRLVIFDASNIHSASEYFGTVMENSRLWQMFFFDT